MYVVAEGLYRKYNQKVTRNNSDAFILIGIFWSSALIRINPILT